MKCFLIDLHNHLIDRKGKRKKMMKIATYILKRCNHNVDRIFAFTDHFEEIKKQYDDDKLKKYEKLYNDICNEVDSCKCLIGMEIDVCFDNINIRHVIVIFKDFKSFSEKIKNFIDGDDVNTHLTIEKDSHQNNVISEKWKKLLSDSIVFPHFAKSTNRYESKNRNFNDNELLCWNSIEGLPKIKFLEVSNNLYNFLFAEQKDIVKDNDFDLIFTSDQRDDIEPYPPLASYIHVDDIEDEKAPFDILKNFLNGKNKSTQSPEGKGKINLTNTKINLIFSPNSLIYGSRGSGKSELCRKLNFYFGNNEQVFFLKQGEYIINKKEEIEKKFTGNSFFKEQQREINDKMGKIESIFCDKLWKINPSLMQSKKELDNEINKKNLEIQKNIEENLNDSNHTFEKTKNKYKNIEQYKKNTKNNEKFDNIKNLLVKYIDFLKSFFGEKHEMKHSDQKNNFSCWLKEIFEYLISEYEEYAWRKAVECCTNEIFSQLKSQVSKITKWIYRFNFSLFDYYLLKQLVIAHKEIICKIPLMQQIVKYDGKYGLKFKINLDDKDYFKIKKIELKDMELMVFRDNKVKEKSFPASFGQVSEFLIKSAIEKNKESTIFILDEPEYGLDNNFIKNDLSPFLNKTWVVKNKYLFLVTHNHVMWSELFEQRQGNKTYIHCIYDGYHKVQQSTKFKGSTFLDNYEAGSDSYECRSRLYNNKKS